MAARDYFKGKAVFITGAGGGVGRETALIFAREGANVICTDIDLAAAEETAKQVDTIGTRAVPIQVDVCERHAVKSAIQRSLAEFGRIDFQFNNAGAVGRRSTFLEIDDALWNKGFQLNTNGVFYGMQEVLPHMLERGKGVIVNIASMAYKHGGAGNSVHYAAAKAAVLTMTMGVAREFAARGIRAISISPGPIETNFMAAAGTPPELKARFVADIPMGRMAKPQEIGELVLFLCSDSCEYLTADTVEVNGGSGYR